MQDRPTLGVLSNQGLCHLCSVANTTESFSETKFRKKKSKFFGLWKNTNHTIFIYGKMFIIEISYNVLYLWHCMELYDKKFFINENCMIRSFGQPGVIKMALNQTVSQNTLFKIKTKLMKTKTSCFLAPPNES